MAALSDCADSVSFGASEGVLRGAPDANRRCDSPRSRPVYCPDSTGRRNSVCAWERYGSWTTNAAVRRRLTPSGSALVSPS